MDKPVFALPLVLVVLAWIVAFPVAAQAGYYLDSVPDYQLAEVSEEAAVSMTSPHPLVLAAQEVSGVELIGMFELVPGMARYFEPRTEPVGGVEYLAEFEIVPTFPLAEPQGGNVSYSYDEGRVVVGFGVTSEDDSAWRAMTIISYWVNPDGSIEELVRYVAGAEYCQGIYALDLTRNGVTELIIPWATGVAGGGGVDIVAVVPTGGLATFGDDPEFASIWSTWGSFTLLDYNRDGRWDIETFFPVLCNPCGYYGSNLLMFDKEQWDWLSADKLAPGYYEEQAGFYGQLVAEVKKLVENPEPYQTDDPEAYGGYGVVIGGEMHSLMPFISDEGLLDELWIGVLLDYSAELQEKTAR